VLLDQLSALEKVRRDGVLSLPDGRSLKVTNLHKVFWPKLKLTKGDLIRYYAEAAPYIMPVVADRPLVMKRFPNGVAGKAFYQQRAREERPPAGVRIETLEDGLDPISEPDAIVSVVPELVRDAATIGRRRRGQSRDQLRGVDDDFSGSCPSDMRLWRQRSSPAVASQWPAWCRRTAVTTGGLWSSSSGGNCTTRASITPKLGRG
jgi:hypothetical protein